MLGVPEASGSDTFADFTEYIPFFACGFVCLKGFLASC